MAGFREVCCWRLRTDDMPYVHRLSYWEPETIERALDAVITEHVRNRLTVGANDRFVNSGFDISDAYGTLDK
jgi:hypothetical protein